MMVPKRERLRTGEAKLAEFPDRYSGSVIYDEVDSTDHWAHGGECDFCTKRFKIGYVIASIEFMRSGIYLCSDCLHAMAEECPLSKNEKRFNEVRDKLIKGLEVSMEGCDSA